MTFTVLEIAKLVDGVVEGNPNTTIAGIGKIETATRTELSFLGNIKYEDYLYKTAAAAILVSKTYLPKQPLTCTLIRVADVYSSLALLMEYYQKNIVSGYSGIEAMSYIDSTAKIAKGVYVGAFSYVSKGVSVGQNSAIHPQVFLGKNVQIGDHCVLHAGVKIYDGCVVGNRVMIHAGTVIGSDGFGFAQQANGGYKKIPQLGNVVIEDNVEIGANCVIDRATIGSTLIKSETKLDNLIQIAHNVEIGNACAIAALAGISGSTKIGSNVMIGGQAGLAGHLVIADGTKINAQSGVSKSIKRKNTAITGTPAADYTATLRSQAVFRNLPNLSERVQVIEKKMEEQKQNKQ